MQCIAFEKLDGIGVLTVNRPESMNALNAQVLTELESFFADLAKQKDVRVLIITGAGDKAFVAGADIKELDGLDDQGANHFGQKGQDVFRAIEQLEIPVIAAVNGFALGGGLELALACDFIFASDNAKLGLPEVSLGLMPGFGGTVRLSRLVGLNRARQMIYTGDFLDAARAFEWGIVNQVTAQDELMALAKKTAEKMAKLAPLAIAAMKKSVQVGFDQDIDAAMSTERDAFAGLFSTQDQKEGTRAFIEKRKPVFAGE